ncbi:MAG: 2,3-bisphosphoglycerate-independent phosphoglycerate mutase [Anaerolineae bacterium]|jgi:2,3-bisphosphoglycerate-independent phosphoglycerate mutase
MDLDLIQSLVEKRDSKIVLLVLDGLGGLPMESGGKTELEAADTPNLDRLARDGICGLQLPVAPGITPGSGPGHLGLFGYDPLRYQVGRGVLSALGIGFDLTPRDVAARGNFCTVDDAGRVVDRRAGRIPTEQGAELCERLRDIQLDGAELFVKPVKEYRFLLVLRGDGLSGNVGETDPLEVGEMPLDPEPGSPEAESTAQLVRQFVDQARQILSDSEPANMVLLRGFSQHPDWPKFGDVFGLRAAAIAAYPMYRGVARLVGMDLLDPGHSVEDEFSAVEDHWDEYDFFFLHVKHTDSAGEDGDFERKVSHIEKADALVPRLTDLGPDVLVVTGDHSTPALLKYHSWHPVPVLLWSEHCRQDGVERFGERACMAGGLGPRIPSVDLMPLAMANARRLEKYGA